MLRLKDVHLWSFKVNPPVTNSLSESSKPRTVTEDSFVWEASFYNLTAGESLKSPEFRFGQNEDHEARLIINHHTSDPSRASFYLEITSGSATIRGTLKIKCFVGAKERVHEMELRNDNRNFIGWGFQNIELFETTKPYRFCIICTLRVVKEVGQSSGRDLQRGPGPTVVSSGGSTVMTPAGQLRINSGLRKLLTSGIHSDVTVVVGDHQMKAHKGILSTHSAVFEAMLASPMMEATSNIITITDVEADVAKEMLRFIYTGCVQGIQGVAQGLLVAADKYNLTDLKLMCEDSLSKNLNLENVCRLLSFSDLHQCDQLKHRTIAFMRSNLVEVQKTEGWISLKKTKPVLVIESLFE